MTEIPIDWKELARLDVYDKDTIRYPTTLTLKKSLYLYMKAQPRGWLNEVVRQAIQGRMEDEDGFIEGLKALQEEEKAGRKKAKKGAAP